MISVSAFHLRSITSFKVYSFFFFKAWSTYKEKWLLAGLEIQKCSSLVRGCHGSSPTSNYPIHFPQPSLALFLLFELSFPFFETCLLQSPPLCHFICYLSPFILPYSIFCWYYLLTEGEARGVQGRRRWRSSSYSACFQVLEGWFLVK